MIGKAFIAAGGSFATVGGFGFITCNSGSGKSTLL